MPLFLRPTACLCGLTLVAGCVETGTQLPDMMPVGAAGQEQACAAAYADQLGMRMSSIRVNGRDTAANGNDVFFLQSANLVNRATCEVNDYGNVMSIVSTL